MNKKLIEEYNQTANQVPCLEKCPRCLSECGTFKQHDNRTRQFLYLLGSVVKTIMIRLFRWKCLVCGKTFTFYPEFIMPHKRYLLPDILHLGKKYLHNSEQTYRSVVQTVCQSDKGPSHSTVWNWLGYLGQFTDSAFQSVELIFRKNPSCDIHRKANPISPRKHRSKKREKTLANAEFSIRVNEYSNSVMLRSIFPRVLNTC